MSRYTIVIEVKSRFIRTGSKVNNNPLFLGVLKNSKPIKVVRSLSFVKEIIAYFCDFIGHEDLKDRININEN